MPLSLTSSSARGHPPRVTASTRASTPSLPTLLPRRLSSSRRSPPLPSAEASIAAPLSVSALHARDMPGMVATSPCPSPARLAESTVAMNCRSKSVSFWPSMSTRAPVLSAWMGSGCEASLTVVRPDEAESALASAATPPSSSALPEMSSISSVTPSIAKTRASAIRPSSAILFAERSSSLSRIGAPLSSAHSGTMCRLSRPHACSWSTSSTCESRSTAERLRSPASQTSWLEWWKAMRRSARRRREGWPARAAHSCGSHSADRSLLPSPSSSAVCLYACLRSEAKALMPSKECSSLCPSLSTPSLSMTSSSIDSAKRLAMASPASPSTMRPSMQNCVTVSHHEPCSIFLMPPEAVMMALTRSISSAIMRLITIEHRCSWKVRCPKR
mmetsp:Transcript_16889/g.41901  ORF Transcript_16889/g.41901 Transcript_16889/m.41901 type:complete len:387 (+) Transcript_16889:2393-3553(+)